MKKQPPTSPKVNLNPIWLCFLFLFGALPTPLPMHMHTHTLLKKGWFVYTQTLAHAYTLTCMHPHRCFSVFFSFVKCEQEAWLQNGTIRDNVLFGEEYEPAQYNHVSSDTK